MLQRLVCAFICAVASTTVLAYTIGQQLSIVNHTDKDLKIFISQVNNQAAVSQLIPAGKRVKIYTENGDNSGWLFSLSRAPFKITDIEEKVAYVRGTLAFFVEDPVWHKYSFLDNVSAGEGTNIDLNYSCKAERTGVVFQNKIILTGSPSAASGGVDKKVIDCEGLKSSTLDTNLTYHATCSDNSKASFEKNVCTFSYDDLHVPQLNCSWKDAHNRNVAHLTLHGKQAEEIEKGIATTETLNIIKKELDDLNKLYGSYRAFACPSL